MIDSVHDDKAMALHQAKLLIGSPHHIGIRVIEEGYDEETDKTTSKVIFKKQKTGKAKPVVTEEKKEAAVKPVVPKKKPAGFTTNIVLLLLAVCGIGLAVLGIMAYLVSAMK